MTPRWLGPAAPAARASGRLLPRPLSAGGRRPAQRGVPARNRIGFAHYFTPGWAADHVIVEFWREGRWQRADPELASDFIFDEHDIPTGPDAPFETAAEAWLGWRAGDRDLSTYGLELAPTSSGRT